MTGGRTAVREGRRVKGMVDEVDCRNLNQTCFSFSLFNIHSRHKKKPKIEMGYQNFDKKMW